MSTSAQHLCSDCNQPRSGHIETYLGPRCKDENLKVKLTHGTRVFHRFRKQYGVVVVHEKLDSSPSSVCVQLDGSTDIIEVTASLLDVVKS